MTQTEHTTGTDPGPDIPLDEFVVDPYGTLDAARARGEVGETAFGRFTLTHEVALGILKDRSFVPNFTDALAGLGVSGGAFFDWMSYSPINTDGEYHKRWRALMARTFTPRSVESLRPFLVTTAATLIDAFPEDGEIDFTAAFADKYPLLALCELIGVPPDDREQFAVWADTIGWGFNPIELPMHVAEVDAAVIGLTGYTAELIRTRRAAPRDDLVSRIAVDGLADGFEEDQLPGYVAGLVFAGHETTKMQLGWMISVLAEHPAVWDRVGADEALAPRVVDEVMRFRSAASGVSRRVAADTEVAGCPFHAGENVIVSAWAANHDPAVFGDDAFDVDVDHAPHLAFGYGAHYCLGAGLAKAELQEALITLAARRHAPVLRDGAEWRPPIGINGPSKLPVTLLPR